MLVSALELTSRCFIHIQKPPFVFIWSPLARAKTAAAPQLRKLEDLNFPTTEYLTNTNFSPAALLQLPYSNYSPRPHYSRPACRPTDRVRAHRIYQWHTARRHYAGAHVRVLTASRSWKVRHSCWGWVRHVKSETDARGWVRHSSCTGVGDGCTMGHAERRLFHRHPRT